MANIDRLPYFHFYVTDYLTSPRVVDMTNDQQGGYVKLLCYCWRSGDCSLPNNQETLMNLSRCNEGALKKVQSMFVVHPTKSDYLTNERLYAEWIKATKAYAAQASGGVSGGKTRKQQRDTSKQHWKVLPSTNEPPSVAPILYSDSDSSPNLQKDSPKSKTVAGPKRPVADATGPESDLPEAVGFRMFYAAYPYRTHRQDAWKAFKKIPHVLELLPTMLDAITRHKLTTQWVKDDGQFIPHPATWLNGQQWTNEAPDVLTKPKQKNKLAF